jgi:hypothetical protein
MELPFNLRARNWVVRLFLMYYAKIETLRLTGQIGKMIITLKLETCGPNSIPSSTASRS